MYAEGAAKDDARSTRKVKDSALLDGAELDYIREQESFMSETPKKRIGFREAVARLKEIRQRPLDPEAIERINDLMEKSEEELKEADRKKQDRKIARGSDIEGAL